MTAKARDGEQPTQGTRHSGACATRRGHEIMALIWLPRRARGFAVLQVDVDHIPVFHNPVYIRLSHATQALRIGLALACLHSSTSTTVPPLDPGWVGSLRGR